MLSECGSSNVVVLSSAGRLRVGSRWRPGYIVRRDSEKGFYEEINPPLYSVADALVQEALICVPRRRATLLQRVLRWCL